MRAQSASFWLGAFMVVEAILGVVVALLPASWIDTLTHTAFGSHWGALGFVAVSLLLVGLVGWMGQRVGWGDQAPGGPGDRTP